ncbi:MAG: M42 family metallopeptidase [Methermicoccaceae archaeon]
MDEMQKMLEELSNAHGISGYEDSIRSIVKRLATPYCDEVYEDALGNVICKRGKGSPCVMVAAHMDEIGLMVRYIDDNGFLGFARLGGWFDQTLLNQRVVVHADGGDVYGVIGSKPPHVMKEEEKKTIVKAEDMFIDVGASSPEEVEEMGIHVGTPITPDRKVVKLASTKITGKCFDNRAGVACALYALRLLAEWDVDTCLYLVGTVQEEVGLKGARTSAFHLEPDVALAVDTTIPGDHPGITKKEACVKLGKGAVINVVEASGRGLIAHPQVIKWLKECAHTHSIPVQLDVSEGGMTDGAIIYLTRGGIPTGTLSIPTRYIHSPVEVVDLKDMMSVSNLLARAIQCVGDYF